MAVCNGCGQFFDWGFCDGKWVLLEPIESHDDLDRTYVDENGMLRADHRDRHAGGGTVNVERLTKKVKSEAAPEEQKRTSRFAQAAKAVRGGG